MYKNSDIILLIWPVCFLNNFLKNDKEGRTFDIL